MLQELFLCAVVALGAVLAQFPPQTQGQGGFRCPQPDGQFEFPQDCTKFYQCNGGSATLTDCQPQLIFNPQVGYCDWPSNAPNPGCAPRTGAPEAEMCRVNPYGGNPSEAFQVASPGICNAFYTCSNSYLFAPCTFCGEGMYFNTATGLCVDYLATGQDINALCQGREFVQHADKILRQIDGSCWPFSNQPNPFQALADAIRAGGGQIRPRPNSGFNYGQTYNYNQINQGYNPGFNRGFNPSYPYSTGYNG